MDAITKLYEQTIRFVLNLDKDDTLETLYDYDRDVWDCMLESGYLTLDGELIRSAYRYLLQHQNHSLKITK